MNLLHKMLIGLWAVLFGMFLLACFAVGILLLVLQKHDVEIPYARQFIEHRLNSQAPDISVSVGAVTLQAGENGFNARLVMRDVQVDDKEGRPQLVIPKLSSTLSFANLTTGQISPRNLVVSEPKLEIERGTDGRITFLGLQAKVNNADADIGKLIDGFADSRQFSGLNKVQFEDADLLYLDHISGREWSLPGAELVLIRRGEALDLRIEASLLNPETPEEKTTAVLSMNRAIGSEHSTVVFKFENAKPEDVAGQVKALDWLTLLDAPIGGALSLNVDGFGRVLDLAGVVDISAGTVKDASQSRPIKFDGAKGYFSFDAENDLLNFSQLYIHAAQGSADVSGLFWFHRNEDQSISSISAQLNLDELRVLQEDIFAAPVTFGQGAANLEVTINPLSVDLSKAEISRNDTKFHISGRSLAGDSHWVNTYDVSIDALSSQDLMQLWPLRLVPKTRKWSEENIKDAKIGNVVGKVGTQDGVPYFDLNFDMADVRTRFMKTMPLLQNGQGSGQLTQDVLLLSLDTGVAVTKAGETVVLDGTSLFLPDINKKPTPGIITLKLKSSLPAALELLDQKPFEYLSKVNMTPEVAKGQVVVDAELTVPLIKDASPDDVVFTATARLSSVKSDTLIKSRKIEAADMVFNATEKGLTLEGQTQLDQVAMDTLWSMAFGTKNKGRSDLKLKGNLTPKALKTFGVNLPKGAFSGQTQAEIDIQLVPGSAPSYQLSSTLAGAILDIPAVGWHKDKASKGALIVEGELGDHPTVERLSLDASGLTASGSLDLRSSGGLNAMNLSELTVGNWMNTNLTLNSNGSTTTGISVHGGTIDLRKTPEGSGDNGDTVPLSLNLDRVILSDQIVLTNFKGELGQAKGLTGPFSARINGGAKIKGTVFLHKNGPAFDIEADNAGAVLRDVGFFTTARNGTLRMVVVPRQNSGDYDGTFKIKGTRVKDANTLAKLLNALSVVGLLQQLNGDGIHFETVEGQFELRPNGVRLIDTSAVGASMGITLGGWYGPSEKTVDFEGVVTPLYVVNGMFERLFGKLVGRGKGEGLFGFTYGIVGPADNPQVTVNPLSVLTPGSFREIFRREPPAPANYGTTDLSTKNAPSEITPSQETPIKVPKKKNRDNNSIKAMDR